MKPLFLFDAQLLAMLYLAALSTYAAIIYWIYEIRENSKKQVLQLSKQTELLEAQAAAKAEHEKVLIAQLNLMASLCYKSGVDLEEINEIGEPFGITYK